MAFALALAIPDANGQRRHGSGPLDTLGEEVSQQKGLEILNEFLTFSGSRPGGLIAAAWATLVTMGEEGYLEASRRILETADVIKRGIRAIPELHVLGEPLFVIAFSSDTLNIYQVMERLSAKGWNLNGLHKPPAVHLCVTLRHAQPGVAERFLEDLRAAVDHVRANPEEKGTMAPVYGMAATVPFRGLLSDLLKKYMDLLYKV